MMYPHRRFLWCTAAVVDAANALYAKHIDRDGAGEHTFSAPLSAGSARSVTHYGADTAMTQAQFEAFPRVFAALIASGDVGWVDSAAGRSAVEARLGQMNASETDEPRGRFKTEVRR